MANTLFPSMHISAAAMSAQKQRMDVLAQNIANAESTHTPKGGPYRRRQVVFSAVPVKQNFNSLFSRISDRNNAVSVKVSDVTEDPRPFHEVFDPGHPDADKKGMVKYPNVNPVEEMVDLTSAARSFEANVTAMEASKNMFLKSLELLR